MLGELQRGVVTFPAFDGEEFAPPHAGPGGEYVHDEIDVASR